MFPERCGETIERTCEPNLPDEALARAFQWLFELSAASLRLLHRASLKENLAQPGRVIHELATTGVVYNSGNLVEMLDYVRGVYRYWPWSADRTLLEEVYGFCKRGVLEHALGECDPDGDPCGAGRSIIDTLEMHAGVECVDVASYTWDALRTLADMARALGDHGSVAELEAKAAMLADRIRDEWWIEQEGLFADVRASRKEVGEALERLGRLADADDADTDTGRQVQAARRLLAPLLQQHASQPDDKDLPWLLRHWVVLCPLEVGVATAAQAKATFARLESEEFCNEWGMYLHPDRRHVMSINTALLAVAEPRSGRLARAMERARKMSSSLTIRTPGAISEALPDRWDFLQLWSAVGIIAPIAEGVFGISPRAHERSMRVIGRLPDEWPGTSLQRVRIGDAFFDLTLERTGSALLVRVEGNSPFSLDIGCRVPESAEVSDVRLNGSPAPYRLETSNAGRCMVCTTAVPAELRLELR